MLCYVMLCYVMSCHVMSCHVMLCYVVMLSYVANRVPQDHHEPPSTNKTHQGPTRATKGHQGPPRTTKKPKPPKNHQPSIKIMLYDLIHFYLDKQGVNDKIMSLWCRYCQILFSRADSRSRHEKNSCQRLIEDSPKCTFPTEMSNGNPKGMEMGDAFRFKTPSSILVVGLSGCGKTCFTESLLLDHPDELFENPSEAIHYCYGAWQDGFVDMQGAGVQLREGLSETDHLKSWFPDGGILVLDDLMAEGSDD